MSPSPSTPAVVCSGLSFDWPDGTPVLRGLDVAFDSGRTGIVGTNGSGKSTLLRLIAGRLAPTAGAISTVGSVGYLPQDVALGAGRTVAELLGVADQRAALHAVEAGDAAAVATVGDDGWDVEERAVAALARFGLPTALDRPVGTLSGGEAVLTGLAGLLVRRPPVALLDEPTNNLDRRARGLLYDAVATSPGVLLVVSHDRELLELVDSVAELRDGSVRLFGGRSRPTRSSSPRSRRRRSGSSGWRRRICGVSSASWWRPGSSSTGGSATPTPITPTSAVRRSS
ncbi:ATP-binding cassette domain-containing protein [Pseudonocardia nigra]|uniref:ATP-binding cassette domain-containing protein n=1 Tax=Pseudonocardia nigra TaxID=1921578 RepID=UPI001C5E7CE2|nr:ATP-binding cassette domain-containing protein [Pseudonocardia nigra]